MTARQVGELGVLQLTLDDALESQVSVIESKCRLDRLFGVLETGTCKVNPLVFLELLGDSRYGRFGPLDACERSGTIDLSTNRG